MPERTRPAWRVWPVVVMALAGCRGEDTPTIPDVPERTPLEYGGGAFPQVTSVGAWLRDYLVVVPPTASPDVPAPLLMVFHGAPQSVDGIRRMSDMDAVAGGRGWIVVYPETLSERWAVLSYTYPATSGQDDVTFMRRIIDLTSGDLNIDASRIYAAGFSNGALFTHRIACSLADRFAAVASVGATMSLRVASDCLPPRPVPAVLFLGDQDGQFPWNGIQTAFEVGLSADDTAVWWSLLNHCESPRAVTPLPDLADDGTTVELWRYTDCSQDAGVDFYAQYGAGHTWPGSPVVLPEETFGLTSRDISASEIAVEFLSGYRLPQD